MQSCLLKGSSALSLLMKRITLNLLLLMVLLLSCEKEDNTPEVLPLMQLMPLTVQERNVNFTACMNIRLSAAPKNKVVATMSTEDGTAVSGEDYIGFSDMTVEFAPGIISKDVCFQIIGDEEYEKDEFFYLNVTDVVGATLSDQKRLVTIENDDINRMVSIPETGYVSPDTYAGMELIWRDEFDTEIDPNHWTFEIGNGRNGWGNQERQYYREENASILDGHLVITAREENFAGFNYTSSRMITEDKFSFRYGRVDIRAALPYGQGMWPALWMLGSSFRDVGWPHCGEIDIMEMIGGAGRENTVHGTVHWEGSNGYATSGGSTTLASGSFHGKFHVFSIIWDDESIRWYVDDRLYNTMDIRPSDMSEFREEFFLIVNLAVGGRWPGYPDGTTEFPQHFIVDYIRVFQDL